jgi:hypothetical protein
MDFADVEQRWQQHVNEFFAEQGMPEEFFYEARGDGEEPQRFCRKVAFSRVLMSVSH